MDNHKPRFEVGIDATTLMAVLRNCPIGETVTYEEMAQAIKRSARAGHSGYGSLVTARRLLERDEGVVFEAVTSVGLKRLDDTGKLKSCTGMVAGIGRRCRRVRSRLKAVDYDSMQVPEQQRHNAISSIVGAISLMSKPAAVRKIEDTAKSELPTAETLKLFSK
jgi:hypothetical protein